VCSRYSVQVRAQLVLAGNLAVQLTGADEIKMRACVEKGYSFLAAALALLLMHRTLG